jgi:ribosome maturation factor RimP
MEGDKPKAVPFFIDMANLTEKLKSLVQSEADAFGLFLVDYTGTPAGFYRFYVDSEQAVTMNLLAEFTRAVSKKIDEGDFGDRKFTFEISTPGADRPLSDFRQYAKHVGRTLEIETQEGEVFEAVFTTLEGETLHLQRTIKEKGKKPVTDEVNLYYPSIKKATIKITFN